MKATRRFVVTWCALALAVAGGATAAAKRVTGTVTDSGGTPLAKVTVTLTAAEPSLEEVTKTDKKGEFEFAVPDESEYVIRLEKAGYVPQQVQLTLAAGQTADTEWVLVTEAEAAERGELLETLEAKDKATQAYNRGVEAYNANDLEGAIAGFREALEANAEFDIGYAALGRVLLQSERWGEAQAAAEAFLERKPEESLALQILYDGYWGAGDAANAEKVLDRLRQIDAGGAVAVRVFNQAVAATKVYDYEAAAAGFTEALERDPDLHQALLPLAQIYFSKGEWQAAIDKANEFLVKDPGNARANMILHSSYRELGNKEAADKAFAELERDNPTAAAEMFLRDGINLFNAGEIAEATSAVQTSIALDPSNPQSHHQLGLCYASGGENAKAKAAFEKFLEIAPDHPDAATVKEMLGYLN